MNPPKTKRNRDIFKMRKSVDKKTGRPISFRKIASHFNIDVKTAFRAYKREMLAVVDK